MSAVTVDRVLALARAELGYVAPAGGSKFGREYGIGAGAWCAAFVSTILKKAGLTPGSDFPWHAFTPNGVAWGKRLGRWHTTNPQPGDLVYFMWPDVSANGRGTPPVCHVGFVEAVQADGSLITIEGNTSSTVNGSQYNGGTVARRVRRGYVVGYVTPNYGGWYDGPLGSRQIMPGDRGDDVKAWQEWLNEHTDFTPELDPDGENGPLTQGRTTEYQASVGAKPDGIPGPETFGKAGITYSPATPAPKPTPTPKPEPKPPTLQTTGRLDEATIRALQHAMGTDPDGTINGLKITAGRVHNEGADSPLIRALQSKFGTPQDGCISYPRSTLVATMQRVYRLGTVDGYITAGYSALVAHIQRLLINGKF